MELGGEIEIQKTVAFMCATAIALSALTCAVWIAIAKRLPWQKDVREDVPERHRSKIGTPTMGGISFILPTSFLLLVLAIDSFTNTSGGTSATALLLLVATLMTFGLLGVFDDLLKGLRRRGMKARYKLLWQGACATAIVLVMMRYLNISTNLGVIELGKAYIPIGVLLIMASCNAMNLTDGLDGLACGLSLISLWTLIIASLIKRQHTPVTVSAVTGSLLLSCSLLGFLPFNIHPAKVFMGDTGSLALGAFLCTASMMMKFELLWMMSGLVTFIEMLTVIIQVISFKTTRKRVFPMTPVHHSFELIGWSEWQIVILFWVSGAICSAGALALVALAQKL
ncbi:MAG: hypothetical protein HZRFUVUK_000519 [Candidatus Fervidibacterota bacterium]|jgi:phospho-N-acetylmuramoyl-pentapeptide-transferase